MHELTVHSRVHDYHVCFRDDADWARELSELDHAIFIIDELVWQLHRSRSLAPLASSPIHLIHADEDAKTLEAVAALCDQMIGHAAKRNSIIVSIGGGVVQDATGFLASVLYRGVPWIYVPTTLLAQADSCIGAKTSLNFRHFKNLLGTMYPPQRVIVHAPFVTTLKDADFFSGLGEIVKMYIVAGGEAASLLEAQMPHLRERDPSAVAAAISASLRIKQKFIEEDEFDRGRRRFLNFGHCFGHGIESATDFAVPHGQAVVLGMILAGLVASARGRMSPRSLDSVLERFLLPTLMPAARVELDATSVIGAMRHDKKRSGPDLALVMPKEDWSLLLVDDLTEDEARAALGELPGILGRAT